MRKETRVIIGWLLCFFWQPVLAQFSAELYVGEFVQLPNFEQLTPVATGDVPRISPTVTVSPNSATPEDNFALVFTKTLEVPEAGQFEFFLTSDDGSRLFIDGQELINNDGTHQPVTLSGQRFLPAGTHQLRLEYFDSREGETLVLTYRTGSNGQRSLPSDGVLSPTMPAMTGQWGAVIPWPEIAISAANLPDGRVLTWSSVEVDNFLPADTEFSHASLFDPQTGSFAPLDNNFHDMFCSGLSMTEDGRIIASGGNPSDRRTTSFDFRNLEWSPLSDMLELRWYGTNITLSNNQIFSSFAKDAGDTSELYTPERNVWSPLPNVTMQTLRVEQDQIQNAPNPTGALKQEWYALLAATPQGKVFQGGPTPTWHIFDPIENTPNQSLGQPLGDTALMFGNAVTYDIGKVLVIGGADRRAMSPSSIKNVVLVDLNGTTPDIRRGAAMNFPRTYSNSVTLPNGEVLVIGGTTSAKQFSDEGTVLPAEIYSPATDTWRVVAEMAIPRNYHSTAILLKDARVLAAGGGACGQRIYDGRPCTANHQDGEIYSPPYLFAEGGELASRPELSGVPAQIEVGGSFVVNSSEGTESFSVVRLSAITHHINTDQRFIPLDSEAVTAAATVTAGAAPEPAANDGAVAGATTAVVGTENGAAVAAASGVVAEAVPASATSGETGVAATVATGDGQSVVAVAGGAGAVVAAGSAAGTRFRLTLPDNPNVLIPGLYWVFALDAQGTPSIGETIQVVRNDS